MNIDTQDKMHKIEFNSLEDFYNYIINTPINETFRWCELSSTKTTRKNWYGTDNFEEASDLFKNGWTEMTEVLNNRLNVESKFEQAPTYKNVQSVEGYHPIVPLYLMGIPNNMISKKMVHAKQKVININKSINYDFRTKTETIIEESIKAMRLIKKLESQNYRVNLNLVFGICNPKINNNKEKYFVKIRLKSSTEKLNISKLCFPLVHPSMLRRLIFRFIEVYPTVSKDFTAGYGRPLSPDILRSIWPNDILLPQFILKDIEKISTLKDLENL